MGSEAGMGVSVGGDFAEEEDGGDLGEDGVGVRMNSRQRMTLSLVVIFRVLVVMVDRFWVRWYMTSSDGP